MASFLQVNHIPVAPIAILKPIKLWCSSASILSLNPGSTTWSAYFSLSLLIYWLLSGWAVGRFFISRWSKWFLLLQIVSEDTDAFFGALVFKEKLQGKALYWENLVQAKTRVNITALADKIEGDSRLQRVEQPIKSMIFAMALGGNDLTGGFHGIGSSTFFASFLRRPINLFNHGSPSLDQAREFLKMVFFLKHERALSPKILDSSR